jgi:hypothetical protein
VNVERVGKETRIMSTHGTTGLGTEAEWLYDFIAKGGPGGVPQVAFNVIESAAAKELGDVVVHELPELLKQWCDAGRVQRTGASGHHYYEAVKPKT